VTAGWLVDKSAYARLELSPDADGWLDRINRGLVHITTITLLEIGYSALNAEHWSAFQQSPPISLLPVADITPRAERRAVDIQGQLALRGQHRAPSIPDLLIAAVAETAGLTVLHLDKDLELISAVTGQPMERLIGPF